MKSQRNPGLLILVVAGYFFVLLTGAHIWPNPNDEIKFKEKNHCAFE